MCKIRFLVRNDHSRIVKFLNVQNLLFAQKRVSKETNTQNLLAKWLSTKTFRNHEFFKNMQIQNDPRDRNLTNSKLSISYESRNPFNAWKSNNFKFPKL